MYPATRERQYVCFDFSRFSALRSYTVIIAPNNLFERVTRTFRPKTTVRNNETTTCTHATNSRYGLTQWFVFVFIRPNCRLFLSVFDIRVILTRLKGTKTFISCIYITIIRWRIYRERVLGVFNPPPQKMFKDLEF